MSTVLRYLDEVDIPAQPADPADFTIDLAPFIDDVSAKAIFLRFHSPAAAASVQGLWEIGNFKRTERLDGGHSSNWFLSLSGGTTMNMNNNTGDPGVFSVAGEFHDGVVMYAAEVRYLTAEVDYDSWIDRQPTPQGGDVLDDIQAVIVAMESEDDGDSGVRTKGSVDPHNAHAWPGNFKWAIVGLDENGEYQTYTSGKPSGNEHTRFLEMGYILKEDSTINTILNPHLLQAEPTPTSVGVFENIDLSAYIPEDTSIVGGRWIWTPPSTPNKPAFIRPAGSSDSDHVAVMRSSPNWSQVADVSAAREVEYTYQAASNPCEFTVLWYELPPPPPPPPFVPPPVEPGPIGARLTSDPRISPEAITSGCPVGMHSLGFDVGLNYVIEHKLIVSFRDIETLTTIGES